eukprot:936966-Prorocentrum_minimum.AAC.2
MGLWVSPWVILPGCAPRTLGDITGVRSETAIEYKTIHRRTELHKHFHLRRFLDPTTGPGQ